MKRTRPLRKVLSLVLAFAMILSVAPVAFAADTSFDDVNAGMYYTEAVSWAVENGITNGIAGTNNFEPDGQCTRAQAVTFLYRHAGEPASSSSTNPFSDVSQSDWYYSSVLWAVKQEITNGIGGTDLFGSGDTCTRAQIVTFLYRYAGEPEVETEDNPFTDVEKGDWYYEAVLWAVENDITKGYGSENTFEPDLPCTRGQIVTFLHRYNSILSSEEPEVTEPEATEPEATEPEATEPEATEPEATEPEATEPEATLVNLALNRLSDNANYEYIISGGGTGYDSTGTMHADGTRYTVSELENESLSRLTDGVELNDTQQHFNTGWESLKWNDMTSQRSKYVEFYRNDSRELTIDLGQVSNINELNMHFGAVDSYGIYLPVEVSYYLSQDGVNYYEVGTVDVEDAAADANDARNTVDDGELMLNHADYQITGLNYNARYVKIIFPINVYAFADEIYVVGTTGAAADAAALTDLKLYDPNAGVVDHYATYEQAGGVQNEYMAYSGWYIYSDDETRTVASTHKTVDEYLSAIAYVKEDGTIADWMFDDVTVMGHEYTSQGTYNAYHEGHTDASEYATKEDWQEWLNYAFGKNASGSTLTVDAEGNVTASESGNPINLEALNAAAGQAKEALNDPNYKVGVKLVLWPAVHVQSNWGELDGKTLDFTIEGAGSKAQAIENRLTAVKWYVDLAIDMWEEAGYENLELTGFYYYEETIRMSVDRAAKGTAQAVTNYVKTVAPPSTNTKSAFSADTGRLYIYWLPYYQSEGFSQWADFGFDYALMQPNYAFYDIYTIQQLYECGELCETYGLGMQMEFGGISKGYIRKFKDYLLYGGEIGYQNTVLSWYMSTYGCYQTSQNEENTRILYDAIYTFINGGSVSFDTESGGNSSTTEISNLALGKVPTFGYTEEVVQQQYWTANEISNAMGLLTDGENDSPNWWVNDIDNYYIAIKGSNITGPYSVTIDLEDTYNLTTLSTYFYDRTSWGVGTTQSVEYFVSADGENWTSAGTVAVADAIATEIEDTRNPNDQAPTIYNFQLTPDKELVGVRYVKAVFAADNPATTTVSVGEMEVYGYVPKVVEATNVALSKTPSFEYSEEVVQQQYWTVNEISGAMGLLTDGQSDSPNWWVNSIDNYYIGINSNNVTGPYAVVLDLEDAYTLTSLSMYFYDRTDWGVGTPQSVEYFVSADGENWTSAGTVAVADAIAVQIEDSRNPSEQAPTIYQFRLEKELTGVRYIKAAFAADHPSVKNIGIGEMEAYGYVAPVPESTNMALSKTVTFGYTEEVTQKQYWTANEIKNATALLTDGDKESPNWWVNSIDLHYIGIDTTSITGPYSFMVDLENACELTQLSMYFYDRTDWGVGTTQAVEFFVSTDGENWTSAGTVSVADASATQVEDSRNPNDQAPSIYSFVLNTQQTGVRYVKAVFAADHPSVQKIGVGEIEVYGYAA